MSDHRLRDGFRGLSTLGVVAVMLLAVGAVLEVVAVVRTLQGGKPSVLIFVGLGVIGVGQGLAWQTRKSPRP